ncbi:acyltransferase family protein [Corynebacterium halotolerans]|uniref:acyltransferase family protein n=1 Tax=Corynebacterium halotolerans TaxID=225326 RepID=UPI003CEBE38E
METTAKPVRSVSYRYDLDGLRGIAIAFVVIFHVFVGRVSGGVDVFLLLSGFFFLGSQVRYASRPEADLNPWWPIWRTLRRLAPTLAVVLAAITVCVLVFTPQLRSGELVAQLAASLLYFQNWELASQAADYEAASVDVSPLQHLWSMSVQGQFYLLAIALALGLAAVFRSRDLPVANLKRLIGPILIVLTIVSFCYAWWLQGQNQSLNYYSTFARLWEMTLGGVLAIYLQHFRLPRVLSSIGALIGLAMVLTTGVIFDGALDFPGPAALYPLGGAVLVILGGGPVARVLASKFMRWLGDIAYPLYLWHWPLLILVTVDLNQESPSRGVGLVVVAASIVLADLTHRFVEKPLQQQRKRPLAGDQPVQTAVEGLRQDSPARLRAGGGVLVGVLVAGMFALGPIYDYSRQMAVEYELDPQLYPGVRALSGAAVPDVEYAPDPDVISEVYPPVGEDGCMAFSQDEADHFPAAGWEGQPCVYGDPAAETTVFLVGGSHAEQWSGALDEIGRQQGFTLIPLLRQGCPLYIDEPAEEFSRDCLDWNRNAMARIIEADPDLVISTTTRPSGPNFSGPDVVPAHYLGVWDELERHQIPFLGLRDNPWGFDQEREPRNRTSCVVAGEDPVTCGSTRPEVYAPVDPAAAILSGRPGMRAVDTADWFCGPEVCPAVIGNIYVYRDRDHLSTAYVSTLIPMLGDEVAAMLRR